MDKDAPAKRTDGLWLYSGPERIDIDVWGGCVSRDVFKTVSKYFGRDGRYRLNFYGPTSFFAQFSEHISPDVPADDAPVIGAMEGYPSAVSCVQRDCNKTAVQEMEGSGAEWLVIDGRGLAHGLVRIACRDGRNEYLSGWNKEGIEAVKEALSRKGTAYDVEDLGIDIPGKLFRRSLERLSEFVKRRYGRNVILLDAEEAKFYMDQDGNVSTFGDDASDDRNDLLGRFEKEFAKESGCHRIRQPGFMVCDAYHGSGLSSAHFAEEYYWYAFESIGLIMSGAEDAEDRVEDLRSDCDSRMARIIGGMGASPGNRLGRCRCLIQDGSYEEAIDILDDLSRQGEPRAMMMLGTLYVEGIDSDADIAAGISFLYKAHKAGLPSAAERLFDVVYGKGPYDIALKALRESAEAGQPGSMFRLGKAYKEGIGVKKDLVEAERLFEAAAKGGVAQGANELFDILWDRKDAAQYHRMAEAVRPFAEGGDGKAMWRLGRSYRYGKGVDKDMDAAMGWMRKAIDNGAPAAGGDLFDMLWEAGTEEALLEMKGLAMNSASNGERWAYRRIGMMYWRGMGVERDLETAAGWMREAVAKGNTFAPADLFDILSDMDTDESRKEMMALASEYADKGESWAMRRLGEAYRRGKGVEKDVSEAVRWFESAARKGNASAACDLFDMAWNLKDEGLLKKAVGMLEPHAKKENAKCAMRLGKACREGRGVEKDLEKALKLTEKAAKLNKAFSREYEITRKAVDGSSR